MERYLGFYNIAVGPCTIESLRDS